MGQSAGKLKEVAIIVMDITKQPVGYLFVFDNKGREERYKVTGEFFKQAGGEILVTAKHTYNMSTVHGVTDMTGNVDFVRSNFMRRELANPNTIIPFDVVSDMLSKRYGKPYHVYTKMPLSDARAVIAPRGSDIIGIDADEDRDPYFLFKTRKGDKISLANEAVVITFDMDAGEKGYTLQDIKNGTLTYDNTSHWIPGDVEYMLNRVLG